MIIDVHGHIGTWHDFFLPEPSAQWLVETNDRIGIDAVIISHLVAIGHDTPTGNRMALDAARQYPGTIGVWLVANPHSPGRVAELRDQLDEPGVCGFKFHPDAHEYAITDPGYYPYLELAEERGLPVLSHGQTRSLWSDPGQLATVCSRHEALTLLMGHSGLWVDGFERAVGLANEHPRLYLEVCGSRLTSRWLERIVAGAGAEKVLFGSDASFLDPRIGLGKVLGARLAPEDRALVLGGNAVRILGERWHA
jgi:uncharacterized protein